MAERGDLPRLLGDLIRYATVVSVDHDAARCTVRVDDDLVSGPIPFLTAMAGSVKTWAPPTVGEQVALFSPEGDIELGFAVAGFYSAANPAPSADPNQRLIEFPDGAVIAYDFDAHELRAQLPAGGKALISAPDGAEITGSLKVTGDVEIIGAATVSGDIEADGDVKAGAVSLKTHVHTAVEPGPGLSGAPQ